jgi:repressor LexA
MMVRKSKGLSERHRKILEFLESHQNKYGYPPSIREIGEKTGISSTSVVNYYLDQLEKMDYIERDRRISRGVRLKDKLAEAIHGASSTAKGTAASVQAAVEELLRIPVLGRIAAGEPIPVFPRDPREVEAEASVDIARSMLPTRDTGNLYALEVKGDSMIDAMVNDGDYVILRPTETAQNGEMVAIWLPEEEETTLKYFYKEKDGYRFQPANPNFDPIRRKKSDKVEIKGKVVMVVRQVRAI